MKIRITLFVFVFSLVTSIYANNHEDTINVNESNTLSVDEIMDAVFDHVLDAYEFHIITIGEKHISLPLPIILIDEGKLVTFSSAKFNHGHTSYLNYKIADKGPKEGRIVKIDKEGNIIENASLIDISITKNAFSLMLSAIILCTILIPIGNKYKKNPDKAPKGFQALMDMVFDFVINGIAKDTLPKNKYWKYVPYLLTLFLFILLNNLMGIIPFFPFGANASGNIAVTMTLALIALLVINFSGNKNYWREIFANPQAPAWLYPILIPTEIMGMFTKPFALMVRLFANITAGHIIILCIVSVIFIIGSVWMAPVSILLDFFMYFIELLVAFLQAYIFTVLTSLFIGLAMPQHEEN
jgi:F-type H+-transporting ATPase subunit a